MGNSSVVGRSEVDPEEAADEDLGDAGGDADEADLETEEMREVADSTELDPDFDDDLSHVRGRCDLSTCSPKSSHLAL